MDHRLAIATIGRHYERAQYLVITEYEAGHYPALLLHARPYGQSLRIPANDVGGCAPRISRHYLYRTEKHLPDLILWEPATRRVIAIEVELTRKAGPASTRS